MEKNSGKESFKDKLKDKKYKAKVELIVYGALILLIIIGVNINSTNNKPIENVILPTKNNEKKEEEQNNLLLKINDNFEYDTKINYKESIDDKEDNIKEYTEHFFGKACKDNLIINKEVNNTKSIYYKATDEYYKKKTEEEGFDLIEQDEIYGNIDNKYIELDGIKKYLNIASLDHVTNYSNGLREEVYHLNVGDVIKSYKGTEVVEISVSLDSEKIYIKVDYSNLYKEINSKIKECIVSITYSNIDKVEVFDVIKDNE